ncbi:MAG: cell filamentation protein Fic, partial [Bacilli bacterium]|nr:cell filamentation protein Fic [Bacilli bacterium]
MVVKTSIRYFNNKKVRAVWYEKNAVWFYAASDLVEAITGTENARRYWNTLKSRHVELSTNCRQLKLTSKDGKQYLTDVIDEKTISILLQIVPNKYKKDFLDFIHGLNDPLDEQSKKKAYELYDSSLLNLIEVGTSTGLKQIHSFIFAGLYDFAGKYRTVNISKGGFMFANYLFT